MERIKHGGGNIQWWQLYHKLEPQSFWLHNQGAILTPKPCWGFDVCVCSGMVQLLKTHCATIKVVQKWHNMHSNVTIFDGQRCWHTMLRNKCTQLQQIKQTCLIFVHDNPNWKMLLLDRCALFDLNTSSSTSSGRYNKTFSFRKYPLKLSYRHNLNNQLMSGDLPRSG